ncbi:hypothetical protein TWF730_004575 [Orbilia blumenaviensis]|uniref:Uncharacterized protein n=1 Tax=Orbilia blumenaviensis TaxID=1796055 RepID=A0AAV9U2W4_9PEZI
MTDTYSLPLPMSPRKPLHHPSPLVSPSYEYAYSTPPSSSSQGVVQIPRGGIISNGVNSGVGVGIPDARRTPSYATSSSISSSSYAGSAADEFEDGSMETNDLVSVLTDRLVAAFDPIPLDRSLVVQAQTLVFFFHINPLFFKGRWVIMRLFWGGLG